MSKILANQIANYADGGPIEIKEGLNVPTGKPLQVNGATGTSGQVLSSDGTGLVWTSTSYFSGNYNDLTNKPVIPNAQVNADWNSSAGVSEILNKPSIPPISSVTTTASGTAALSYNNSNGEFTYTPPDLSSYLTSYTETDPIYGASAAANVTTSKIGNWDTTFGWGDHSLVGYLTSLSSSNIGGLQDVNLSTPPTADQVLKWDAVNSYWKAADDAQIAGATTLGELNNVSSTAPSTGQVLKWDGSEWAPGADLQGANNGIVFTDLSVNQLAASGTGTLSYNNNSGVFTYTPPQLGGFLTTETDPVFSASAAANVTAQKIANWDTSYGWGDHGVAGYLTAESDTLDSTTDRGDTTTNTLTVGGLVVNGNIQCTGTTTTINTVTLLITDNEITLNQDATGTPSEDAGIEVERGDASNTKIKWNEATDRWSFTNDGSTFFNFPVQVSDLANDAGYLTGFTETDPVFSASVASSITTTNLSNWNTAYNWGNHSSQGYLEDGDFPSAGLMTTNGAGSYSAVTDNTTNWNTAHGWGDHSGAGYLTSIGALNNHSDVTITTPSNDQVLKYNGSGWVNAADSSANVTTDDAAPTGPQDGDLWWKSDEGRLKVYYQDANSSQWVDASPPLASASAQSLVSGSNSVAFGTVNLGLGNTSDCLKLDPDGPVVLYNHLLPAANNTYDIGSADRKIRDIYEDQSSDIRLKKDVVGFSGGLDFVNSLRVVDFTWKDIADEPAVPVDKEGKRETGFIAQEISAALQASSYNSWRLHNENPESYQGIDPKQLIPALVSAIQELSARLDAHKKKA